MKRLLVVILCTVLSSLHVAAQKAYYRLIETPVENVPVKSRKSLLLIVSGPMSTRKYIQDLQYELKKDLDKKGVTCLLEYAGDDAARLTEKVNAAVKTHQPDCYLVIQPVALQNMTTTPEREVRYVDPKTGNIVSYVKRVPITEWTDQVMEIHFYDNGPQNSKIWEARLQSRTNLAAEKIFRRIAADMLKSWKEKGIISTQAS
ncbi:hypothetical protein HHL17_03160 [Chitinophaga sp. G-6-1-13]|uniref:DUF4136 domain-containing protein n=1 Tax=Chitinophaga fulva TaxID=2728842 RepID=A0A848GJX2_9BACT|nr:hypothetical protein [Chitinophaga fulva]NML36188.1 hypothetical protein [Chitinophaga fulva]